MCYVKGVSSAPSLYQYSTRLDREKDSITTSTELCRGNTNGRVHAQVPDPTQSSSLILAWHRARHECRLLSTFAPLPVWGFRADLIRCRLTVFLVVSSLQGDIVRL